METPGTFEILQRAAHVVRGEMSIRDFEDWFVPATWDIESTAETSAIQLSHQILHFVTEFDRGAINDDEFRASIRPLVVAEGRPSTVSHATVQGSSTASVFTVVAAWA